MKKKKIAAVILAVMIGITAFSGCGTKENKSPADTSGTGSSVEAQEDTGKEAGAGTTMLEDGMYSVNVELQGCKQDYCNFYQILFQAGKINLGLCQ